MTDDTREKTVDLVSKIKAGDNEARYRLLERAMPPLRSWARGRLPQWARSLADTQDLVQDVVARTLPRLEGLQVDSPDALQKFLRKAVKNQIIDEIRKARSRPRDDAAIERQTDPGPGPEDHAVSQEELESYRAAMQTLEPAERHMLRARVEERKSYTEIATMFGKPSADAARMAVNRAIAKLARAMTTRD